jgi:hypothetical protein
LIFKGSTSLGHKEVEKFVRSSEHSFLGLLSQSSVIFYKLFDTILRNYEMIYGPDPVSLELCKADSYSEFLTKTVYLQEQLRALKTPEPKREPKKLRLPPSRVIKDIVKFFEGHRSVVSTRELETTIYTAWRKVNKDKADHLAVSRYIDRFKGVLWKNSTTDTTACL